MRLTLSTLRCPDTVPPETRSTGGGEFSLGRAPDNSWVLADPDRHLSKRHCILAYRNGGWQIADTSTNGTYLNREASPIGQGQIRDLQDGDRIRLGAYEIEVRIEEAAMPAGGMGIGPAPGASPFAGSNPFDDDVFAPAPPPRPAFGEPPVASAFGSNSPMLPPDFDPLAPGDADPFRGPSIADHSPSVSDAFRPPPVIQGAPPAVGGGLPDDWDLGEPLIPPSAAAPQLPPAPPPPAFAPAPVHAPPPAMPAAPDPFAAQPLQAPPPTPQPVFAPPPVTPHPQAFAPPSVPPAPTIQGPPPEPVMPAPPPMPRETPFGDPAGIAAPAPFVAPEPAALPPVAPVPTPAMPMPAAPPPAAPMAAMAPPAAPTAAAPMADGAALAAFLRGAGMHDARMDNPIATMEELGKAFRHIVSGLRAVLIARASIKGEFRIEQTMIRARGNNPLKFSADDDDALNAFFGTGRRTSMGPAEAVAEALRDITLHELAVVAAMQAATREVLKWLSPEEAMASAAGGLLPMQKKANAFDVYADTHQALLAALSDDFERVYGKAFAEAYEEALRDAARQKPEAR